MTTPLIEMRQATMAFRGIRAISGVDFTLMPGEVHALLGENGAGKSTLTKCMCGVNILTSGTMLLDGQEVSFASPAEALRNGVTMVFQETSLVPSMSVAQNLFLGDEKLFNRIRGLNIAAQTFLQSMNFNVNPTAMVASLGAAHKQMVEIARAVRKNVRVIIFDEPTAALTPEEKYHFFSLVARLKEMGVAIIFISHALEEALEISDRLTVLRDGKLVESGPTAEFDRDRIVRAMVGREVSAAHRTRSGQVRAPGERILSVQNLSMGSVVRNTSFSVYTGQVTGMFGLIGSGRTETAKIISGVVKRNFFNGGEIVFDDQAVRYRIPRPAVRDGIVYVTEDRKVEGFFETMSLAQNLNMGRMAAGGDSSGMLVSRSEIKALAEEWTERLAIRAIDSNAQVIELSGGNQQKVVIAKSLVQRPKLVIFDEPTRGVDVGAIVEIHDLINRLADEGMAVVVISSYLPEVMALSDRILVCRSGRVVEELAPDDATEEKIMFAAVH